MFRWGGSYTGLNTIAVPLEKIVAQIQQNPADCSDPNISQEELEKCLTGDGSSDTYTKDNPKIQNPIAKKSTLFFYTPTDITINNGNIRTLWTFMLGVVDAFLVVILVLNGVKIILTGGVFSYSRAVEEFPSVLLAIIVAHISLTFMMAFIGLNNNMTNYIYTFAQDNPNIHRSRSGFGAGDTKEYTLRLFFPSAARGDEKKFEGEKDISPEEAAKKWPGPEAPNDNTSSTSKDIKQFNPDMFCTVEQVNFDNGRRYRIFGNGDPLNNPIRNYLEARTNYMVRQAEDGRSNIPTEKVNDLKGMPAAMEQDVANIATDPLKWYNDWQKFTQEIDQVEKDYILDHTPDSLVTTQRDLSLQIYELFYAGAGAIANGEEPDYRGDAIKFICENDATGSAFQLVPDDLDFENLFKNLSEMGKGLKMVIKLLALMMLGQMIIRLFFINLYIITAPLGIACWALPGRIGQPVARLWLQGFITTVIVQFVMVIATIITQVLLGNVLAFVGGDPNHIIGNLKDGTLADLVHIACLWFVIRIPSLLGSAPMNTMAEAGQMMSQAVGTTVAMQITQFQMVTQAALSGVQLVASVAR